MVLSRELTRGSLYQSVLGIRDLAKGNVLVGAVAGHGPIITDTNPPCRLCVATCDRGNLQEDEIILWRR